MVVKIRYLINPRKREKLKESKDGAEDGHTEAGREGRIMGE